MARKATIQILRGTVANNGSEVLGDGELFYDTSTKLLYVGDGSSSLSTLSTNKQYVEQLSGAYAQANVEVGKNAVAQDGTSCVSVGEGSSATSTDGIAIGHRSKVTGNYGIALGRRSANGSPTMASGSHSIALGNGTISSGEDSIAIGYGASVSGDHSVQIGSSTSANNLANTLRYRDKTIVSSDGKINADTAKDYDTSSGTIKDKFDSILGSGTIGSGDSPLQGYNKGEGTIESRLNRLGFSESAAISIGNVGGGYTIKRQGNYAVANWYAQGDITLDGDYWANGKSPFVIPDGYRPKETQFVVASLTNNYNITDSRSILLRIAHSGVSSENVTVVSNYGGLITGNFRISFGYECAPRA